MCFLVLFQRLSQIDSNVRRAVSDVQSQFGDIVTFQVCWLWYDHSGANADKCKNELKAVLRGISCHSFSKL